MFWYIVGGVLGVFSVLGVYSCCAMSGINSRREEELELECLVNEMLETGEYETTKVTIDDCMCMNKKYHLGTELSNGRVVKFKHE